MSRFRIVLAAAAVATALPATAFSKDKVPELSATELAAVQSRTYALPQNQVFASAVAALQQQGYLGIEGNKDAGTISGSTDAKSKLMFNIIWGLGKKKYTQTAQFLVQEIRPGQTTLTLNLFLNESKTRSIVFGQKNTDATVIRQPEPYNTLLAAVDEQVAKRSSVVVPAAPASPAAAAAVAPVANTAAAPR